MIDKAIYRVEEMEADLGGTDIYGNCIEYFIEN